MSNADGQIGPTCDGCGEVIPRLAIRWRMDGFVLCDICGPSEDTCPNCGGMFFDGLPREARFLALGEQHRFCSLHCESFAAAALVVEDAMT